MSNIEILAPAGSMESMRAAINAGCDAVYMGGSKFSARAYADNPEQELLLSAIDFAHMHEKQLYLTVNTLLKEEELKESLYKYLRPYYLHGLDAVIVQDVGVLKFVHEHFPKLPIHASTQMTLTMAEGVNELKDYNVTRMVPARELSLTEIARIRKNTDLEIEAFVHGALCYCYSGQCFMSSMNGNRSGNRGRCAQPCRMEYTVTEGGKTVSERENSYLLSPKDMCTLSMVGPMIEAGINSFKIEGRMKRPEYVAGVVKAYKNQVDEYNRLGKEEYEQYHKKHPEVIKEELRKLQDLYNRGGFNTGYYDMHNGKDMMSMHRPNHSGVLVGKVVSYEGIRAQIRLCEDVNAQDILEFRHNGTSSYEFTVKDGTKKGQIISTNTKPGSKITKQDEVYRTRNNQLLHSLEEDYLKQDKKLSIVGELTAKVGVPLTLEVRKTVHLIKEGTNQLGEPITITVTKYSDPVTKAQKAPVRRDKVEEKLKKTNETPFVFQQLDVFMDSDCFFPMGQLNELRREALSELETKVVEVFRRNDDIDKNSIIEDKLEDACVSPQQRLLAKVTTRDQARAAMNHRYVTDLYLDSSELSLSELPDLIQDIGKANKNIYLLLPPILRGEAYDYFVKNQNMLSLPEITGYVIKNMEELSLLRHVLKTNKEIRLDYNMYVMNREAVAFYQDKEISHFTAPIELNSQELKSLPLSKFDIVVYGYLPTMVSAQCIRKNTSSCRLEKKGSQIQGNELPLTLIDRMSGKRLVKTNCRYCYNTIYSAQCLSLLEELQEIKQMRVSGIRLDFTIESGEATTKRLTAFGRAFYEGVTEQLIGEEYCKGHYRRGIL